MAEKVIGGTGPSQTLSCADFVDNAISKAVRESSDTRRHVAKEGKDDRTSRGEMTDNFSEGTGHAQGQAQAVPVVSVNKQMEVMSFHVSQSSSVGHQNATNSGSINISDKNTNQQQRQSKAKGKGGRSGAARNRKIKNPSTEMVSLGANLGNIPQVHKKKKSNVSKLCKMQDKKSIRDEMIWNLLTFCKREKSQGRLTIALNRVMERVCVGLKVSRSTVIRVMQAHNPEYQTNQLKKKQEQEAMQAKKKMGRPPGRVQVDLEMVKRRIKESHNAPKNKPVFTVKKLAAELSEQTGQKIGTTTLWRELKQQGITHGKYGWRIQKKKPKGGDRMETTQTESVPPDRDETTHGKEPMIRPPKKAKRFKSCSHNDTVQMPGTSPQTGPNCGEPMYPAEHQTAAHIGPHAFGLVPVNPGCSNMPQINEYSVGQQQYSPMTQTLMRVGQQHVNLMAPQVGPGYPISMVQSSNMTGRMTPPNQDVYSSNEPWI